MLSSNWESVTQRQPGQQMNNSWNKLRLVATSGPSVDAPSRPKPSSRPGLGRPANPSEMHSSSQFSNRIPQLRNVLNEQLQALRPRDNAPAVDQRINPNLAQLLDPQQFLQNNPTVTKFIPHAISHGSLRRRHPDG